MLEGLITSLISGGLGGNLAGMLLKKYNLGWLWNTVVGVLGGAGGMQILQMFGLLGADGGLIANIAGSAVGGGLLMVIVGLVKDTMSKQRQAA